jgi:hypothetical protein
LVQHFCVGEASGTKEKDTESTLSTDNDDSEPATPVVEGSDGFSDTASGGSGEDRLCREPGDQAILSSARGDLTTDERGTASHSEAPVTAEHDGDEISLPMVLCSLENEYMTTGDSISEAGCMQMESMSANFLLEDTWNSDSLFGSSILGNLENYVTGESQSPLSCTPLDKIDPVDFAVFT